MTTVMVSYEKDHLYSLSVNTVDGTSSGMSPWICIYSTDGKIPEPKVTLGNPDNISIIVIIPKQECEPFKGRILRYIVYWWPYNSIQGKMLDISIRRSIDCGHLAGCPKTKMSMGQLWTISQSYQETSGLDVLVNVSLLFFFYNLLDG